MLKHTTLAIALLATPAFADPGTIKNVHVTKSGGLYTFDVTVSHGDSGWDHYADAWRIKDADGKVLGQRELAHPHVNEQPFTRSLSGVRLPEGTKSVTVEVRDTASGWSPNGHTVKIR